jgi:hypothetical protein
MQYYLFLQLIIEVLAECFEINISGLQTGFDVEFVGKLTEF